MKFVDEGYIIHCRKHGENSLIVTVLCKEYGKVCGYVKSGLSKRNLATFQPGNKVKIDAWSRVDDNMLSLKVELIAPYAVNFLADADKLRVLSCLCALCRQCLPELQPRLFSFNNPYGACPACAGLGMTMDYAPELVVPDETLSLDNGAVVPEKESQW